MSALISSLHLLYSFLTLCWGGCLQIFSILYLHNSETVLRNPQEGQLLKTAPGLLPLCGPLSGRCCPASSGNQHVTWGGRAPCTPEPVPKPDPAMWSWHQPGCCLMSGAPHRELAAKPPPMGPAALGTWVNPDKASTVTGRHFGTLPSEQDATENEGCDPPL